MAAYLLEMKPHLFKEAVAAEFSKLQAAREAEQASAPGAQAEVTDLVLSRRAHCRRTAPAGLDTQHGISSSTGLAGCALPAGMRRPPAPANSSTARLPAIPARRRMAEVRRSEQRHSIEELMYVCILECFQEVGVRMMPAVAPIEESLDDLKALTGESREAGVGWGLQTCALRLMAWHGLVQLPAATGCGNRPAAVAVARRLHHLPVLAGACW